MKTGILCHGRHLQAKNWNLHQWGDIDRNVLGQILKTMQLTHYENPSIIIFGTGSSGQDGLKESEYTIRYMFNHFYEANKFSQFNDIKLDELYDTMKRISIAEKESQNTKEELENAGKIFLSQGVERIILVSNPDHISRCMQLAHTIYQDQKFSSFKEILGTSSDIGYKGTSEVTSRIIEMPHRGDDKNPDLSKSIRNYFKLPLPDKERFVKLVDNFFNEL